VCGPFIGKFVRQDSFHFTLCTLFSVASHVSPAVLQILFLKHNAIGATEKSKGKGYGAGVPSWEYP